MSSSSLIGSSMHKKYPRLSLLISEIIADNWGSPEARPARDWVWPEDVDYDLLEEQTFKMSGDDLLTLAVGEQGDAEAIVKEHGAGELHEFLNEVFDGKYSSAFMPL